jgi:hypothetical protein
MCYTFYYIFSAFFGLDFYVRVLYIQHSFICHPSDFTVSEDDGIELSSQIHKDVVVNFSPISQGL